jgi:allantoate deiminase
METLRAIKASRVSCKFNLEAIDLTDKHGALIGQMGSRALAGTLTLEDLQHPRGGRDRLLEELTRANLNEAGLIRAVREPRTLIGNIELQIDLSGQLQRTNASIGIVTDIAGIVSYRILFIENRERDRNGSSSSFPTSSQGASSFVLNTRQLVLDHFPGCTANTGMIEFHPGEIPGDIPDHIAVSLEFRALNTDTLNRLETALIDLAHKEARKYGAEVKLELLEKLHPATTSAWIQNAIARSADQLGLLPVSIQSMAGQNAQTLRSLCPTGVILVSPPSKPDDVPQKASAWQEFVDGADVLLNTVFHLSQPSGWLESRRT